MRAGAAQTWGAPIVFGAASALVLLPLACRLPNAVVPDDGYFYSRIATQLALRGWSTFDGVHTTSGYHLPWGLVLAAVSRVILAVSTDPRAHLFGHLAVAMTIAFSTVRAFFTSASTRVAAMVLVASTFGLTEMVLALPLVLALQRSVLTPGSVGTRRDAVTAIALGLVRVDLACVPAALALPMLRRDPKRGGILLGGAALGAALQMLVMRACFGHFTGVAAWLKVATRADVPTTLAYNFGAGAFTLLSYVAVLVLAALALALRPSREVAIATAATLSFLAVHTCLSLVRPWYWVPSWLGTLHVLDIAMRDARASRVLSASRAAVAVVTLAFVLHGVRAQVVYAEDQRIASRFLAELRARVPAGARLFTYDNPGFLGTFSGFDVIDGDGLVNDHAYARRFVRGELAGYLDEEGVCFVVMPDADGVPVLDLAGLVLDARDVIPLVTLRRHRRNQADFVLYELTAPRCARR